MSLVIKKSIHPLGPVLWSYTPLLQYACIEWCSVK